MDASIATSAPLRVLPPAGAIPVNRFDPPPFAVVCALSATPADEIIGTP
jgi:hypothetical protein